MGNDHGWSGQRLVNVLIGHQLSRPSALDLSKSFTFGKVLDVFKLLGYTTAVWWDETVYPDINIIRSTEVHSYKNSNFEIFPEYTKTLHNEEPSQHEKSLDSYPLSIAMLNFFYTGDSKQSFGAWEITLEDESANRTWYPGKNLLEKVFSS